GVSSLELAVRPLRSPDFTRPSPRGPVCLSRGGTYHACEPGRQPPGGDPDHARAALVARRRAAGADAVVVHGGTGDRVVIASSPGERLVQLVRREGDRGRRPL